MSSTPSAIDVMAANLSALTAILSQISEQNRTIIKQNAEVIRLLKIPKLKQSSLTDSISRTPKKPKSTPPTSRTVLSAQEGSQERKQAKRMRKERSEEPGDEPGEEPSEEQLKVAHDDGGTH